MTNWSRLAFRCGLERRLRKHGKKKMPEKIDRDKTIEQQIWNDIAPRVMWFTAKQIAKKLQVPINTVRKLCEKYYRLEILDKTILNNINHYRVKP